MDLMCTNCGEPWEVDYVLHEDPVAFKRHGSTITACPSCDGLPVEMSDERRGQCDAAAVVTDLLGDDIDGAACELEDFGLT